jgi:hypothetical protein
MAEAKRSTANGELESAPAQVKRNVITRARGYLRRSRSVRLIEALLATGRVKCDDLACALSVTPRALESYRRGRARMPLERQLCLALLVIERWPYSSQLRRNGFGLRSQVLAEAAFHARITKTHMTPMVTPWVRLR